MIKSTEMLKELCNERGIEWKTQYAGALGKLLEIFDEDLVFAMMQKADERLAMNEAAADKAVKQVGDLDARLRGLGSELRGLVNRAENAIEAMKSVNDDRLDDSKNAETLRLYRMLLKSGVEVFGAERMTNEAIASICESASYIVYRTIMGPKSEEHSPYINRR